MSKVAIKSENGMNGYGMKTNVGKTKVMRINYEEGMRELRRQIFAKFSYAIQCVTEYRISHHLTRLMMSSASELQ